MTLGKTPNFSEHQLLHKGAVGKLFKVAVEFKNAKGDKLPYLSFLFTPPPSPTNFF